MSLVTLDLITALADGRFHTGDALGVRFGVSKAAIWKAIKKLDELGLDVHSVRGKGYRLNEALTLLDHATILAHIAPSRRAHLSGLEILHSIDSTNAHAMRRVQAGALDISADKSWVCLAESQSAGKGRRGREWVSPFGHNLYLSLVREHNSGAVPLDGLSLVVGIALVSALLDQGYSGLQLKWPNDVLLNGRKLAGILLEVTGDITSLCHVVVGVGLNLRSDREAMQSVTQAWTALDQAGFVHTKRNQLAGAVLNKLLTALAMFEHAGFEPFQAKWQEYDCAQNHLLQIHTANGVVEGMGRGVNQQGALLVETAGGVQTFHGGEVSLRLQDSPTPNAGG